jgi:hypothetical protein
MPPPFVVIWKKIKRPINPSKAAVLMFIGGSYRTYRRQTLLNSQDRVNVISGKMPFMVNAEVWGKDT